jgi:predicted HAD superfamily Cof-like phosphohydrolase
LVFNLEIIMSQENLQQAQFMLGAGQTTSSFNWAQAQLYAKLVNEEAEEFAKAASRVDKQQGAIDALELTEMIDGAADLIVVAKGFLLSLGVPAEDVMSEVWRSNLSKLVNGKVIKREDGKVLKPEGWTPPDFAQFNPLLEKKTA